MTLLNLTRQLIRYLLLHPKSRSLQIVSMDLWLPKTIAIEPCYDEGHISIDQVEGHQEL